MPLGRLSWTTAPLWPGESVSAPQRLTQGSLPTFTGGVLSTRERDVGREGGRKKERDGREERREGGREKKEREVERGFALSMNVF